MVQMPRTSKRNQLQVVQDSRPGATGRRAKKGTAETMIDEEIVVTLKDGSGLSFKMGEPINPKVMSVRYVLNRIYESSYVIDLTPAWAVQELFIRVTVEQLSGFVPAVLVLLNDLIANDEYRKQDEHFLTICSYVLAWWYHMSAGGPRPIYETARMKQMERYRKVVLAEPVLRCEFCNRVYKPPKHLVKYSTMARAFYKWLYQHYWEYHKWEWAKPEPRVRKPKKETENGHE